MNRLLILVEGQTEEAFVKSLLSPHLIAFDIFPVPKLIYTKRLPDGTGFKGGVATFGKIEKEVRLLLGDSGACAVTTMIDFYRLPHDFPRPKQLDIASCFKRVKQFEQAFADRISSPRFLPYLSLHEFEALLFSSPEKIADPFPERDERLSLLAVRNQFASPEEIDDGPETAPSKQILKFYPAYQKRVHGLLAAQSIGIAAMRRECLHFNEWLTKLESFGQPKAQT